jgi:hypothetical protein
MFDLGGVRNSAETLTNCWKIFVLFHEVFLPRSPFHVASEMENPVAAYPIQESRPDMSRT